MSEVHARQTIKIKDGDEKYVRKMILGRCLKIVKLKNMKFDFSDEEHSLVEQFIKFLRQISDHSGGSMCVCERLLMEAVLQCSGGTGLVSPRHYAIQALPLYKDTYAEKKGGGGMKEEAKTNALTTPVTAKNAKEKYDELLSVLDVAEEECQGYMDIEESLEKRLEDLSGNLNRIVDENEEGSDEHTLALKEYKETSQKLSMNKALAVISKRRSDELKAEIEVLKVRLSAVVATEEAEPETKSHQGDDPDFTDDDDDEQNVTEELDRQLVKGDNAVVLTIVALKRALRNYQSCATIGGNERKRMLHKEIVEMCKCVKIKIGPMENQSSACPMNENRIILNMAAGMHSLSPVMKHDNWLDGRDMKEFTLESDSCIIDQSETSKQLWAKLKRLGEFVMNKVLMFYNDVLLLLLSDQDALEYTMILGENSQNYLAALKKFNNVRSHPNSLKMRTEMPLSGYILYDNKFADVKLKDHPWTRNGDLQDVITTVKNAKKAEDEAIKRMLKTRHGITLKEAAYMHYSNMRSKTHGKTDIEDGSRSIKNNLEYNAVFVKTIEIDECDSTHLLDSGPYLDVLKIREFVKLDMFYAKEVRPAMASLARIIEASGMNVESQGETRRLKGNMCVEVRHVKPGLYACGYATVLRWNAIIADQRVTGKLRLEETEMQRKKLLKQLSAKANQPRPKQQRIVINNMDGVSVGQQYSKDITEVLCGPNGNRSALKIPLKQIQKHGMPSVGNMNLIDIIEKGLKDDSTFKNLDQSGRMDMIVELLKYTNFQLLFAKNKPTGASSKSSKGKSSKRKKSSVNATVTGLHFSPVGSKRNVHNLRGQEWRTWLEARVVCWKCHEKGHYVEDCNKK